MTDGEPLPRLVLIADGFTSPTRAAAAAEAVRGGVRWVHLRDHEADEAAFGRAAAALADRLRAMSPDVRISANTRLDVAQALGLDAHVGVRGPSVAGARAASPEAVLGTSAHSMEAALQAKADGADYLFFSPIFPTSSKPGHPGVGLSALQTVCDAVTLPVYALGGVVPASVPACLDAGAHGIAVLSGILNAADPATRARTYLHALL